MEQNDDEIKFIGSCFCNDCQNYDLVFEVDQCGYYVQCHDTLYEHDKSVHGKIIKKIYPFDFHERNGHYEWPNSVN